MKRQILTIIVCLITLCSFAGTPYVVDANSLNVRKSPSTEAAILGKVTKGQEVNVQSIKNGWACISFQKGEGYVSAQYITKKSTKTTTTNTNTSSTTKNTTTSSTAKSTSTSTKSSSSSTKTFPYSDGLGPRYGGWTELGANFGVLRGGFNLDLVNGCYIRDYIFVGGGVGLRGNFSYRGLLIAVPIYAQARAALRITPKVAPILDFGIGGYVGFATDFAGDKASGAGFYVRVAPGIKIGKHFHMNIGYERCGMDNGIITLGADW